MKIKNYTVISSPNCQLLSTLFCPHLLHPLQICFTHSKFAPPVYFQTSGSCFYIIINTKQECISKKKFFIRKLNIYPLQILSTSTPLVHSPHPLHSACSFSTSTPLRSLILHIHSAPLARSPHPLHPLTVLDKGEKMHMKSSLYISSTLIVHVFKFKFLHYALLQKRQINVCYDVFFAHENKTYSEKYEWMSSLLLSQCSILALPSSSCSRITYHTHRQTDRQTDRYTRTHTHTYIYTHNMYIITMNVANIHL